MKTLPVNIIGDEGGMYIHTEEHKFFVTIAAIPYYGLIRVGKVADGNSTPWFLSWLVKPNGPHVDTGNIHDSLYEIPVIFSVFENTPYYLTRKECDEIYYYFLIHDTGLLDWTFKAPPSLLRKSLYWVRLKKAPEFVVKERTTNIIMAKIIYSLLTLGSWIAWRKWRKKDKLNANNSTRPSNNI